MENKNQDDRRISKKLYELLIKERLVNYAVTVAGRLHIKEIESVLDSYKLDVDKVKKTPDTYLRTFDKLQKKSQKLHLKVVKGLEIFSPEDKMAVHNHMHRKMVSLIELNSTIIQEYIHEIVHKTRILDSRVFAEAAYQLNIKLY